MVIDPGDSSYPDAVEDENGNIYLVHDRGRYSFREIVVSRFTEKDIMAGKLVEHSSFCSQIISKAPSTPWNNAEFEKQKAEDTEFIKRYFG